MRRVLLRTGIRLGELAVVLVVLSAVVFGLLYLAPGDPARTLVGAKQATPELLAAIRERYALDQPLWEQYLRWVGAALQGDFGSSIRTNLPVTEVIAGRFGVTLELVLLAAVVAVIVGVPAGVVAARRFGSGTDRVITGTAVAGVSAPSFAVGLVLLYVFAVRLGWFPVYGLGDGGWLDRLHHLALPVLTLALGVIATLIKVTRAAMIKEVDADYGAFARSRGIGEGQITVAQVRNASVPIVTSTGLVLASLIGGTILVETVFALGGLGGLLSEAVTFKDIPVVQAITLGMAAFICSVSALVDVAVGLVDPRVRLRRAAIR